MKRPLIVVGVDGASAGMTALRWAFGSAARSGAVVEVVHAWTDTEPATLIAREVWIATSMVDQPPEIVTHYGRGPAAEVLVDRSRRAQLLVLGLSPGRRSPGPVIVACRSGAGCPVAVIDGNGDSLDETRSLVGPPTSAPVAGQGSNGDLVRSRYFPKPTAALPDPGTL